MTIVSGPQIAVPPEAERWTALPRGVSGVSGVEGGPSMPAPVCDERFLMRIFAALVVATIMADIGLIWAVFRLPGP